MASPMEQDSNLENSEKNCEGKLTNIESLLSQKSGAGVGVGEELPFLQQSIPQ